jgi:RNA recognition motif-containing protein
MAKNLFVGNLAWETTDDDLRTLFTQQGKVVRAQVVMDRMSGRSRGFGFVEMPDDGEAQRAMDSLHGQPFKGRELIVNEARPRPERAGGYGSAGYSGGRADRMEGAYNNGQPR